MRESPERDSTEAVESAFKKVSFRKRYRVMAAISRVRSYSFDIRKYGEIRSTFMRSPQTLGPLLLVIFETPVGFIFSSTALQVSVGATLSAAGIVLYREIMERLVNSNKPNAQNGKESYKVRAHKVAYKFARREDRRRTKKWAEKRKLTLKTR